MWCTFLYVLEHAQLTREMKAVMEVSFFLFISILWFYMKNSSVCATVNINGYFLFPSWSCDQPPVQGCVVHSFFFVCLLVFFIIIVGAGALSSWLMESSFFCLLHGGAIKSEEAPPPQPPHQPTHPMGHQVASETERKAL